jgi:CubicO group peptidase (beta-lactamase class C family)
MRAASVLAVLFLHADACSDDVEPAAPPTTTSSTTSEAPTTTVAEPTTTLAPVPYGPTDEWETVDPGEAGFDVAALQVATDLAEEPQSHCLLVLRGGRIVHEWYADDVTEDDNFSVFSVTKSVSAGIVGAASYADHVDVDAVASAHITEWEGTESAQVTIEEILQNVSGRFYDPIPDLVGLGSQSDMTAHSIALHQERDPNTAWFYNQSAIQVLEAVVERATGEDPEEFAQQHLFGPLGMTVEYSRDEADNIPMFAGLRAGCRDLGRFALMSSRMGAWEADRVIAEDYMAAATTGTDINNAYGYLYWHNAEPGTWDHTDPRRDRTQRFWPDPSRSTRSAQTVRASNSPPSFPLKTSLPYASVPSEACRVTRASSPTTWLRSYSLLSPRCSRCLTPDVAG